MKKKKNCSGTKGYNCGNSCISVKFACKKDGLSGQTVSLANKLTGAISKATKAPEKAKNKPLNNVSKELGEKIKQGKGVVVGEKLASYESSSGLTVETEAFFVPKSKQYFMNGSVGNHTTSTQANYSRFLKAQEIVFSVNGDMKSTKEGKTKEERKAISESISNNIEAILSNMKDGTKVAATAYNGDGKGKYRAKLYQSKGMSSPDSEGVMRGVIKDGKIVQPDQFSEEAPTSAEDLIYNILFGEE